MKIHTPNGVRDILPPEYELRNSIESRIMSVFFKYGYKGIKPAVFEYNDVFSGIGSIDENKIYRFINRDGAVLALRPDVTPQIARLTATTVNDLPPIRYCYIGDIYRYNENLQGKQNELTQAGAEIYGAEAYEADAEVIAAAIDALLSAGLTGFRVDIGNVEFIKAVIDETGLSEEERALIRDYILNKDFVAVHAFVCDKNIPSGIKEILSDLALCIGDESVLLACEKKVASAAAKAAVKRLRDVYETLSMSNLSDYVLFDLGLTGHLGYYTGIIFRGYIPGLGFSVLDGGRCDGLCGSFGKNMPSVGFAININNLLSVLDKNAREPLYADTLIVYAPSAKAAAYSIARRLRGEGLHAEIALIERDMDAHIAYAKEKGYAGVLCVTDSGELELYDLRSCGNESDLLT